MRGNINWRRSAAAGAAAPAASAAARSAPFWVTFGSHPHPVPAAHMQAHSRPVAPCSPARVGAAQGRRALPHNCGSAPAAVRGSRCRSRPMAAAASAATPAGRGAAGAALKAAVRAGRPLFGLFINSASPLVAEQLAMLDFDYL